MVMRGGLESALYGYYIHRNPPSMTIWASRHDGEEERKRVRSTFTIAKMWSCLSAADPALAAVAELLYDKTIDLGSVSGDRMRRMAIPISMWALVAGVGASAALIFGRAVFNPEVPTTVLWLAAWGALLAAQAASWALTRTRTS